MRWRILVIDDEHVKRLPAYERLAVEMAARAQLQVEFDFLLDPVGLPLKLRSNIYQGAILDVVFNHEHWRKFNINIALETIGGSLPVAIASSHWDATNSEEMRGAWKRANCRTFLHWRDIEIGGSGDVEYAVRALASMLADSHNLDRELELDGDTPITILHVSDLQSGGFEGSKLRLEINRWIDPIVEHCGPLSATFVALTGDVAETGAPSEYGLARDSLEYLFDRLELGPLPSRRLLHVPGNHDVNMRLAAAARIRLQTSSEDNVELVLADELADARLLDYAYAPYRQFLKQVSSRALLKEDLHDHSLAWIEARFRHLGVIFYGINTAQPVSAFVMPARRVSAVALADIELQVASLLRPDSGTPRPVIIGLGHHCPVSASGDAAVDNPDDFQRFFGGPYRTAAFLHGHTHKDDLVYSSNDGLRMVRSCAATPTKSDTARPPDSLRGFNLLQLMRKDHRVRALCARSFSWLGTRLRETKNQSWDLQEDGMFRERT